MLPTTPLLFTALLSVPGPGAGSTESQSSNPRKDKLRAEGRVLTGFDSNVDQRSGNAPAGGVLQLAGAADYARRLPANLVALSSFDLQADIWSVDDADSRFRIGGAFELSAFVIGSGRIRGLGRSRSVFPRLLLRLVASYDFGFSLAQTFGFNLSSPGPDGSAEPPDEDPPSGLETGDEDLNDILDGAVLDESLSDDLDDDLNSPAFTLREPFHRASGEFQARFDPWRSTEIELMHRVIRALVDADPGEPARHFTQFDVGLQLVQSLHRQVEVEAGYRLELREHDARTNDQGESLRYQTHLTEGALRYNPRPFSFRLRHRLRYRLVNSQGRDRTRHTVDFRGRWRLYGSLAFVAEFAVSWEDRIGRPDRDWNRYQAVAGIQFGS